jgi:hypothetical protein
LLMDEYRDIGYGHWRWPYPTNNFYIVSNYRYLTWSYGDVEKHKALKVSDICVGGLYSLGSISLDYIIRGKNYNENK